MSAKSPAFRIIYNFFYYLLYLILLAFLLATPADLIHQGTQRGLNLDIFIIILCYVVTIVIVAFVYATRLYINRSVIASIPKSSVPIEKGDLPKDVRQMVVEGLSRSAAIAYDARPRFPSVLSLVQEANDDNVEVLGRSSAVGSQCLRLSKTRPNKPPQPDKVVAADMAPRKPVWGEIEHPGWSPPTSTDLPNLQYTSVILELLNLIEAKALTIASSDREATEERPALNPEAVALLQRPEHLGLREYLAYLTEVGVLPPLPLISEFIAEYEEARFSARPLSSERFRQLMHLFAELLRNIHPLNPAILEGQDDGESYEDPHFDSDIDNDAPMGTNPSTQGSQLSRHHPPSRGGSSRQSSLARQASSSTTSSRVRRPILTAARNSSVNTWQYRTAPTTPRSRHGGDGLSRSPSANTFAQRRKPYPASQTSSSSLHSSSGGSVIRLANEGDGADLPYVYNRMLDPA